MRLSGCSREFMVRSPKRKGNACGKRFGRLEEFGKSPCDFNITLFQRERSKQGRTNSAMRRFAEVVDELGLVDLPLQGESSPGMGVSITSHGLD